ncbi:RHS repeat domain-containing protein, partial [Pseudoduganella rivuli]
MSRLIYFALSRVLYAAGLCICLCSSALAQNDWRPPVSGWWAIGPVIHGDMTAAADYACRDTLGLHHLDNNSIYCKVYQTASHPEYGTVPLYMGIVKHVSACADTETPGSYDPAKKCYVAGEKPPVCDCVGNPVKFANGEKIQVERDYVAPTGLEFTRYYSNKLVGDQGALNAGWRHGYAKKLLLYQYNPNQLASYTWTAYPGGAGRWSGPWGGMPEAAGAYTASIVNPDGYGYFFSSSDNGVTWVADADVKARLSATRNGTELTQFSLQLPSGDTEIYDGNGRLAEIRYRNGRTLALAYSWVAMDSGTPAYLLTGVANSFGQSLQLAYNGQGRLVGMTDPAGNLYQYEYGPNGLAAVTYPGGGRRQYLYNEAALVAGAPASWTLLTGIADEITPGNVVRYGTYAYDVKGRPVSTSHPNDVDKYTFNYTSNTVTDPLGAQRGYGFSTVRNRQVQTGISQTFGTTKVWTEESFDANGNLRSTYDFNGVRTLRTFDLVRNLELTRVDGFGTASARTTTTNWHAAYALPLKVAEPRRITTYTYDATGNVLTMTMQATTDANGAQGFNATATGSARTWTYTYNAAGQVLTARGPRTDADDTVTYSYDANGNLATVANALGHVTTLSNYDA